MTRNLNFQVVASMIILTGLFSCNEIKNQSGIECIDLENTIGRTSSINYSDIVKEIEYIRLETTSESLIGSLAGPAPVTLMEDYLLISQKSSAPLLFDINGKFVRKIGSIGRGPGELGSEYSAVYNPGDKHIYILTNYGMDIRVFNLEGEFVRNIKIDRLHTFSLVENDSFIGAVVTNPFDETKSYNYVLFNEKGEVIDTYAIPGFADMLLPGSTAERPFGYILTPIIKRSISGTHINTHLNDSVLTIQPGGTLKSSLCWDLGKYKTPFGPEEQVKADKDLMQRYATSIVAFETGKYWIISFSLEKKQKTCFYDKRSGEAFELDSIINDTKFVYSSLPSVMLLSGDTHISVLQPSRLKKMAETELFAKREKETPDEARKLKDLANSIKLDDNPVLMVMKIK
jgi:hypothetical protein